MTVFANGLEVACKAQSNKVIAAFPDVCFTPPENPATPPGVPVPYPSFGMDSDTDKGTSTVKIGGKTVTQKNKSHYTKTTGTEAGAAAKKGIITSKNTGKEFAVAWSNDVKFDGEPVSRFSDLSTNNHGSNPGNVVPVPKIGKKKLSSDDCKAELAKLGMEVKPYNELDCPDGDQEKEHFFRNEFLCESRDVTCEQFKNYSVDTAPTICMRAYNNDPTKSKPKVDSPHNLKTRQVTKFLKDRTTTPTIGETNAACAEAFIDNHDGSKSLQHSDPKKREMLLLCLQLIFLEHLTEKMNEGKKKKDKVTMKQVANEPIAWEVNPTVGRVWTWVPG